jgi:hypothetical protein
MATLGRREMRRNGNPDPPEVRVAIPSVNLGVVPTTVHPVTTQSVQPPAIGGPIMREGFITTTGFMPPGNVD